jgi:hypothetical protein
MKPPEPLPEDAFWALVDASGGAAERLKPLLMCLSRDACWHSMCGCTRSSADSTGETYMR